MKKFVPKKSVISVNVSQFFKKKKKKRSKTTRLPIGEDGEFYGIIYLFILFTLLYFTLLN
jgi:hypothetical protein